MRGRVAYGWWVGVIVDFVCSFGACTRVVSGSYSGGLRVVQKVV